MGDGEIPEKKLLDVAKFHNEARSALLGRFASDGGTGSSSMGSEPSRVKCQPHWLLDRTSLFLVSVLLQGDLSDKVEILYKMVICALRFQTKTNIEAVGLENSHRPTNRVLIISRAQYFLPMKSNGSQG